MKAIFTAIALIAFSHSTYAATCSGDLYISYRKKVQREIISYCSQWGKEHGYCVGYATPQELQGWNTSCKNQGGEVACDNYTHGEIISHSDCRCTQAITELFRTIYGTGQYSYEARANFDSKLKSTIKEAKREVGSVRWELKNFVCQ